jgi:hypothetical protein
LIGEHFLGDFDRFLLTKHFLTFDLLAATRHRRGTKNKQHQRVTSGIG